MSSHELSMLYILVGRFSVNYLKWSMTEFIEKSQDDWQTLVAQGFRKASNATTERPKKGWLETYRFRAIRCLPRTRHIAFVLEAGQSLPSTTFVAVSVLLRPASATSTVTA